MYLLIYIVCFLLQKRSIYIRIEASYSRTIPKKIFTNIIEMQTVSYVNRCFTDVESSVSCQLLSCCLLMYTVDGLLLLH